MAQAGTQTRTCSWLLLLAKILGMDRANLAGIERLRPPGSLTPARLFLGAAEVPDPYHDGSFDAALDLIEAGAARLLDQLEAQLTSAK